MSGALKASGGFEVPTPTLNSPSDEPSEYWDQRDSHAFAAGRPGVSRVPAEPEATLKCSHPPLAILRRMWDDKHVEWESGSRGARSGP